MTALKEQIIEYISLIPEEKLLALKPLLFMLSAEPTIILEKLNDDDLTDEERDAFEKAELECERGETVYFDDYLLEHGIEVN